MSTFLIGLALIASTLAIFLVGREVACWYWKINRMVELMERIESRLKRMDSKDLKLLKPETEVSDLDAAALQTCQHCDRQFEVTP